MQSKRAGQHQGNRAEHRESGKSRGGEGHILYKHVSRVNVGEIEVGFET